MAYDVELLFNTVSDDALIAAAQSLLITEWKVSIVEASVDHC